MTDNIKCANCVYVRQDVNVSEYSAKRCKSCDCKDNCHLKGTDNICPNQTLKWAAYECGNPRSDYHKSLLNVTFNGDKQPRVTWRGCKSGVRR